MNERIKQLRVELELTQMQFAEKIGLSRNYIAMIEMGAREPSDRTISDICRVFGVSEAWLRDGTEPMYVQRSENERMAMLFNDVLAEADESTRKRGIAAALEMPPEFWDNILEYAKKSPEASKMLPVFFVQYSNLKSILFVFTISIS